MASKNGSQGPAFLSGGGEMGALMLAHDWSASPLGDPSDWPQSLRSVVGLMLGSKFPMFLAWGEELGFLYNDSYAEILGGKHPAALGAPFKDVWREIWPDIEPFIDTALAGEASYLENLPLLMNRKGHDEQTWFTFSYSPARDENGQIAGMFCACAETTAQVIAQRQGEKVQERQRQMLRQMPGFVAMLSGPDLIFTYVNDAYVEISERAEFIGLRIRDVFADIADQGFIELLEQVIHTGQGLVARGSEVHLHGREEPQYLDFVIEPIRQDNGVVTGVFIGGYETTEVHRGEEALRVSEARLRELNSNLERQVIERTQALGRSWQVSPDLMGALNPEGYFETSNPAWQSVLGWSKDEVAGMSIFEMLHPDDVARSRQGLAQAQFGQPAIRFANRYRCKDGSYRWISWVGVPEDGMVYCTGRDITADKEAAAERERLWKLSHDLLARADFEGGITAVNPAWTRVLGWSKRELLGSPYTDIVHPEDVAVTLAALEEMRQTGRSNRFEHRVRAKNGKWKPISWSASPEPDGLHFIAVGRDLTDLKAREKELELAREALRQSQKMEAMGSLTGGVAHDFNNLLTPIIGSLDLLVRRGIGSERERRLIDGALQSADRAKILVQRLLAFARRQPLQPVAVDLAVLIDGMAGLIGSTVGPNIDLRVEIADDLPPAKADHNQLEMAILNLGVNARDAMPEGGTLTISAARDSVRAGHRSGLERGHYVRITVADTGAGMDETTRTRAVEPFFSTKGIGKGTGLGLSMVHGLVAQLGGGMAIASEVGRGTTVELWLPVSRGAVGSDGVAGVETAPTQTRGRALLVDDELLVRMSTADMLTDLGFEVVEASTGEEALQLFGQGLETDLLITDHLMPGMNGVELAREVRALKPGLPILVVSGYAEVEAIASELPRLAKPFRNAELAESLDILLRDRTAAD